MNEALQPFYAVVPLSLEPLFLKELETLGITKARAEKGGCWFGCTLAEAWKVNLYSRYASRILWKLAEKPYRTEDDIYNFVREIAWETHFQVHQTIRIELSSHRSALQSLDFTTLRIKDAICDRFRDLFDERPSVDKQRPDVRIYGYVNEKSCTMYLDLSGESLFKRGWREAKGEAPLKENLAAGLLGLAEWSPEKPLYDPFCGSGTIVIEAATIAANMAPGLFRRFGFESLLSFKSNVWQAIKKEARMAVNWDADISLAGSDISTQIVDRAISNARLAGLGKWLDDGRIHFFAKDAREILPTADKGGLIVTNPPYGEQSNPKSASVAAMMKNVSDNLKRQFAGWTVWMLTSDRQLPRQMRLSESRKIVLFNGPLECRFFRFEMTSGSYRKKTSTEVDSSQTTNTHLPVTD